MHGVATLVPEPGSVVHGVVWQISDRDLGNLDRYEGVPRWYVRENLFVDVEGDGILPALIYLATESTHGKPREGYLEGIVRAAREHGLPEGYVEELGAWMMAIV